MPKRYIFHLDISEETIPGPNVYNAENCDKPESKKAPAFSMAKRLTGPNSKYIPISNC